MVFQDTFITDAGSALLGRSAVGEGAIVWGEAKTSSLDSEEYSEEQMKAITEEDFGTVTSDGMVTGAIPDEAKHTVSIFCELTNENNSGVARTFGIWAKIEGDSSFVLAIVSRCGTGVTPTAINPYSQGSVKLFFDLTLRISDHQAQSLAVTEGYYASAAALDRTAAIVDDLQMHTPRVYRGIWEAIALSENGERFGIIQDTASNIELTSINDNAIAMFTAQTCRDGLLFCWYSSDSSGTEPAHAVIFSVDRLRHGDTTPLFDNTSIIGTSYMAGGAPEPIYIDDNLILYGDPNAFSTIHAVVRAGDTFTYAGTVSISYGSIPEVDDLQPDAGDVEGGGMSEPTLDSIYMTRAGTVVKFTDSMYTNHVYVIGIHCTISGSVVTINTYDKAVTSTADYMTKIGDCSGKYWGIDTSGAFYLEDSGAFCQVSESGGVNVYNASMPPHYNAFLFATYDSVYTITEYSSSPKCRKLYQTSQGLYPNDYGSTQGIISPTGGIGIAIYGLYPIPVDSSSTFPAGGIGLTYRTERYYNESIGDYSMKVSLGAFPGDYSRCVRKNGQIFPLL